MHAPKHGAKNRGSPGALHTLCRHPCSEPRTVEVRVLGSRPLLPRLPWRKSSPVRHPTPCIHPGDVGLHHPQPSTWARDGAHDGSDVPSLTARSPAPLLHTRRCGVRMCNQPLDDTTSPLASLQQPHRRRSEAARPHNTRRTYNSRRGCTKMQRATLLRLGCHAGR